MLILPPKNSDHFSITRQNTHTLPVSSERASTHSVDKGKIWCVENCRQGEGKLICKHEQNIIFEEFRQHCSERCKSLSSLLKNASYWLKQRKGSVPGDKLLTWACTRASLKRMNQLTENLPACCSDKPRLLLSQIKRRSGFRKESCTQG